MTGQPDDQPEPRRLTEADVGTTLPCGCEVTRADIPCGDLAWDDEDGNTLGHDTPDASCAACQTGAPAVRHDCTAEFGVLAAYDGTAVYDSPDE